MSSQLFPHSPRDKDSRGIWQLDLAGVKDGTGATDTVTAQVLVVARKTKPCLKAASWNLWDAGTQSTDGLEKLNATSSVSMSARPRA